MQVKKSNIFVVLFSLCFSLFAYSMQQKKKVGLLIVATGKYIQFVEPLIKSAQKYFCTNHEVTYFVFTDGYFEQTNNIVPIHHDRLGWPHDTMMRCVAYYNNKKFYENFDYLFATDADMRFVAEVGDEILGDRVATQHPGFVNKRGTYERRATSTACVRGHEGKYYFAGGFYGGSAQGFLNMNKTMLDNIKTDLAKNIIAVWHDESHLNRYFIDNPPTKILSPSYCYPESWRLPYKKRLLALDKNHSEMRK